MDYFIQVFEELCISFCVVLPASTLHFLCTTRIHTLFHTHAQLTALAKALQYLSLEEVNFAFTFFSFLRVAYSYPCTLSFSLCPQRKKYLFPFPFFFSLRKKKLFPSSLSVCFGACGANQACVNTEADEQACQCSPGSEWNAATSTCNLTTCAASTVANYPGLVWNASAAACVDVNECATTCTQSCVNTVGGYTCSGENRANLCVCVF